VSFEIINMLHFGFHVAYVYFSLAFFDREDKNESQDDSIWLKEKWSIGEVCNGFLLGHLYYFSLHFFINNYHF
jgi:hypothetical protein